MDDFVAAVENLCIVRTRVLESTVAGKEGAMTKPQSASATSMHVGAEFVFTTISVIAVLIILLGQ